MIRKWQLFRQVLVAQEPHAIWVQTRYLHIRIAWPHSGQSFETRRTWDD
jgi:hypothetical protein